MTGLTPTSKWHDQVPHVGVTPEPTHCLSQLRGGTVSLGLVREPRPEERLRNLADDQPCGLPVLAHRHLCSPVSWEENGCPYLVVSPHFRDGQWPTTPTLVMLGQGPAWRADVMVCSLH